MNFNEMNPELKNFIASLWKVANSFNDLRNMGHVANDVHYALHSALDNAGFEKGEARGKFLESLS